MQLIPVDIVATERDFPVKGQNYCIGRDQYGRWFFFLGLQMAGK